MPIYKYIAPNRIDDVLVKLTLRISPAAVLNDIFEASWSRVEPLDKALVLDVLRDERVWPELAYGVLSNRLPTFLRNLLRPFGMALLKKVRATEGLAEQFSDGLNQAFRQAGKVKTNPFAPIETLARTYLSQIGTVCFTDAPTNDIMWSYYADDHRGIVVEYDPTHPAFRMPELHRPLGRLTRVRYQDELPTLTFRNFPLREGAYRPLEHLFLTKHRRWAHEREWRMLLPLNMADASVPLGDDDQLRLKKFPPEAIR